MAPGHGLVVGAPGQHLTDTGYLDAELLVDSQQQFGVDLVGPTRPDYHWQARAGEGFAASDFQVDRESQRVTCPEGRLSVGWTEAVDRGHNAVIKVKFSMRDCRMCPGREKCTQGKRRTVTLRLRSQYEALESARAREGSEEFQQAYAKRAGVEGTISHGVRTCGLRRSRYVGEAKTHLQAPRDRGSHQHHPDQQLADGEATRTDGDIGHCEVDGTIDRRVTKLPTVSRLRKNHFLVGKYRRTGNKWEAVRKSKEKAPGPSYVVWNGDESEPGTFSYPRGRALKGVASRDIELESI
jgi:hypothetical protein